MSGCGTITEVGRPLSLSLSVTAEAWRADGPCRLVRASSACSVNVHFSLNFVTEHLGQSPHSQGLTLGCHHTHMYFLVLPPRKNGKG